MSFDNLQNMTAFRASLLRIECGWAPHHLAIFHFCVRVGVAKDVLPRVLRLLRRHVVFRVDVVFDVFCLRQKKNTPSALHCQRYVCVFNCETTESLCAAVLPCFRLSPLDTNLSPQGHCRGKCSSTRVTAQSCLCPTSSSNRKARCSTSFSEKIPHLLRAEDSKRCLHNNQIPFSSSASNALDKADTTASSSLVSGIVLEAPTVFSRIVVETQSTTSTDSTMKRCRTQYTDSTLFCATTNQNETPTIQSLSMLPRCCLRCG